jgi:hypothetical protein
MHRPGIPAAAGQRRVIALLALIALWLGQAMAVAHASRHVGADSNGLPGNHAQLCTDCASLAPLLAVAGGPAAPMLVPAQFGAVLIPAVVEAPAAQPARYAFRSRAPPR